MKLKDGHATNKSRSKGREVLDLALDVDLPVSLLPFFFKNLSSLARKESEFVIFLFEKMLAVIITDELCCITIRLKSKFFSDES